MRPRHLLALILVSLLFVGLVSQRFTRTRQCRALVRTVNPVLDQITVRTALHPDRVSYLEAASRYEQLAAALGPLEFGARPMAEDVAGYAAELRATAQALRDLVNADDVGNAAQVERFTRELERLEARTRLSVTKMDAWCQES